MYKRRKRKLILEKHKKPLDTSYVFYSTNNVPAYRFNHNQVNQGSLFNGFEPYKSNRFMVFLIKYEYKLNYSESDFLLPRFYYKIFD